MAARGSGFSACNHSLLVEVAALHNDPSLQDIAIENLNDPDPEVVGNAAMYLGQYGSAEAEEPLWDRLASWSATWKGREAEFKYVPGENMEHLYQEGAGNNLIAALGSSESWLTNEAKLSRLIDLSVGADQRSRAEQILNAWEARPREIQFIGGGQIQIAQYPTKILVQAAIEKTTCSSHGEVPSFGMTMAGIPNTRPLKKFQKPPAGMESRSSEIRPHCTNPLISCGQDFRNGEITGDGVFPNLVDDNLVRLFRLRSVELNRLVNRAVLLFNLLVVGSYFNREPITLQVRLLQLNHQIAYPARLFRLR